MELLSTDIIPIINKAWENLFSEVEPNKKAIVERGWSPYNINLLIHQQLCDSMTMKYIWNWEEMCIGAIIFHRISIFYRIN